MCRVPSLHCISKTPQIHTIGCIMVRLLRPLSNRRLDRLHVGGKGSARSQREFASFEFHGPICFQSSRHNCHRLRLRLRRDGGGNCNHRHSRLDIKTSDSKLVPTISFRCNRWSRNTDRCHSGHNRQHHFPISAGLLSQSPYKSSDKSHLQATFFPRPHHEWNTYLNDNHTQEAYRRQLEDVQDAR